MSSLRSARHPTGARLRARLGDALFGLLAAGILAAGLTAVAASPVAEQVAPELAPQDVSAYCAADFSQITGFVVASASTSAAQMTVATSTKTGTVYVRVTSRDTASACNAYYRYHGLAYATNASGSSGVMDWGLLVNATTTPGNQCWITTTSTDEIMHARNAATCPSGATSPLTINLTTQGGYRNDSAPDQAGDFFFVHTSCDTVYQSGTTGEIAKTGVSMTSTTAGNPGANCHALDTDAVGTTQSFYYDAGLPTASFSAPATSTIASGNTTVTYTTADALSGVSSWSLSRQFATLTNGSCGSFSDQTSVTTGTSAVTGQSSAQNSLPTGCYKWYLDVSDNADNNATRVYSNVVQVDTSGPSAPTVTDTTSGVNWAYRTGNTIYFRQQSGTSFDLTSDGADGDSGIASSTFGTYTGVNGGSFNGTVSGDPATKTLTFWSDNAGGSLPVVTTNNAGTDSSATTITFTRDDTLPTWTGFTAPASNTYQTGSTYTFTYSAATDGGSGLATYHRVLQSATPSNGSCGSWSNVTDLGNNTGLSYAASSLTDGTCYRLAVSPIDNVGNGGSTWSYSNWVMRDTTAPSQSSVTASGNTNYVYQSAANATVYFKPVAGQTMTISSTSSDSESGINVQTYGALSDTTGWTWTPGDVSGSPADKTLGFSLTSADSSFTVTSKNNAGVNGTARTITLTPDTTPPGSITYTAPLSQVNQSSSSYNFTWTAATDNIGLKFYFVRVQSSAITSPGVCSASYTDYLTVSPNTLDLSYAASGLPSGACYRLRVLPRDVVTNDGSWAYSSPILVDNIGPTGSISINSGDTYTGSSSVTLTLSASDVSSVVTDMRFSNDGSSWGSWVSYGTSSSWTTTAGEGTKTVYVQYRDALNNVSGATAISDTIVLDATAPTSSILCDGVACGNDWHAGSTSITIGGSDATSGVASKHYTVDGGGSTLYTSAFDLTEGEHTVSYWATDNAGNVESPHNDKTVKVDATDPETSVTCEGATCNAGWYDASVSVDLDGSDALSGLDATYYTLDGGADVEFSGAFDVTGDGTHTITYWSTDVAGNDETHHSFNIKIDGNPPEVVFGCSGTPGTGFVDGACGSGNWFVSNTVAVTMDASDEGSGMDTLVYHIDTGDDEAYEGVFNVTGDGHHSITYVATDLAGNQAGGVIFVDVDGTAPSLDSSFDPSSPDGINSWYISAPDLTLEGDDAVSGLDGLYYTLDGGAPNAYGAPISATPGEHTLTFWAADVAGNESVHQDIDYKVDLDIPDVTFHANVDDTPDHDPIVPVSVTTEDATSGTLNGYVRFSIDGGQTWGDWLDLDETGAFNGSVDMGSGGDSLVDLMVQVRDLAGQVTTPQSGPAPSSILDVNPDLTVSVGIASVHDGVCSEDVEWSTPNIDGNSDTKVFWPVDQDVCIIPRFTDVSVGTTDEGALVSYVPEFGTSTSYRMRQVSGTTALHVAPIANVEQVQFKDEEGDYQPVVLSFTRETSSSGAQVIARITTPVEFYLPGELDENGVPLEGASPTVTSSITFPVSIHFVILNSGTTAP